MPLKTVWMEQSTSWSLQATENTAATESLREMQLRQPQTGQDKNAGEGGERKRKKSSGSMGVMHSQGANGYGVHDFGVSTTSSSAQPGPSMHGEHGRAPKMAFKKGNRKSLEKNTHPMDQSKPGGMELTAGGGLDGLGLLLGPGPKLVPAAVTMMMPCSF